MSGFILLIVAWLVKVCGWAVAIAVAIAVAVACVGERKEAEGPVWDGGLISHVSSRRSSPAMALSLSGDEEEYESESEQVSPSFNSIKCSTVVCAVRLLEEIFVNRLVFLSPSLRFGSRQGFTRSTSPFDFKRKPI